MLILLNYFIEKVLLFNTTNIVESHILSVLSRATKAESFDGSKAVLLLSIVIIVQLMWPGETPNVSGARVKYPVDYVNTYRTLVTVMLLTP